MNSRKLISISVLLLVVITLKAQHTPEAFESAGTGATTTLVTDYQSLGVNPANLGFPQDERLIHLSFLETGFSFTSDAISRKDIWQNIISKNVNEFSREDKLQAANVFSGAGFLMNTNINLVSFSFQHETLGGLGFVVRERMGNQIRLNKNLAELIFLGKNASYFQSGQPTSLRQIFDESKISGSWYREIILGYGRRVLKLPGIKLYVGLDAKYILGYGNLNISNLQGNFSARSSITPSMDINYDNSSPTALAQSGLTPVGHGFGIDVGGTIKFLDMIKAGVSFNDLGSITWDSETYEAKNITVDSISSSGFDSYNFISEVKDIFQNQHIFQWKGRKEYTTGLPAHVKLGASFNPFDWVEFGVDMYAPFNGHAANMDKVIFSTGGYFQIGSLLKLSAGYVTGDVYVDNYPVGITFGFPNWEMGFSTGDITTFFRHENPTLSLSTGFLRFKL